MKSHSAAIYLFHVQNAVCAKVCSTDDLLNTTQRSMIPLCKESFMSSPCPITNSKGNLVNLLRNLKCYLP